MKAIRDSAIYLIGEFISRAMPLLMLPYLSHKLGVEGFGELAYYQTFLALCFIIVSLSQEGAVARYFYFYGKRAVNLIVATGYIYTLVLGSVILLICWLVQSEIMAYIALCAIFQSLLSVQLSIKQSQKQPVSYAKIQFLLSLCSVFFTVLLLEIFSEELVTKRILAMMVSNAFVFCLVFLFYIRKIKFKQFNLIKYKQASRYLFGFGMPLILHNLSLFLKGQLDKIFIYHQFSQADLGLYAMGIQISTILMIFLQAINKAIIPYFFEGLKQNKFTLSQIHQWALCSFIIVPIPALVLSIVPEDIIIGVIGKSFLGVKYYIVLFLISTTLTIPYFILTNYLFYQGKNKLIAFCSIISTLIYVLSLFGLIFTKIEYVPYAGIVSSLAIIPMLYAITKKVEVIK
ncbi:O-antigen/teichoic acid export membrane protein [Nicoletella semolina]|uniref:O-antigen/teichoic acid export membrane protein n=1 Tax=Nicoletella semolina TaxID=271160 RepID=A0A4R2NCR9_9PAST|nr:oligosaccharide flippase family protein [Nicoletella semolina]MDH2924238.1 Lsg locus protein 1 [Nicoletella semolina]TCP18864.1 O-antigen/teichoic acid export membrane protein [Nicoletella semolina]